MEEEFIKQSFHYIRIWILRNLHLYLAKKRSSIVNLLISMCYDEEETRWQLSPDGFEIICELNRGTYRGLMTEPQSLTLIEAFHVPLEHFDFVKELFSNKETWPVGVEYYFQEGKDLIISIRVYIDLNYKDSPKDYLRGYMEYLSALQIDLHKNYNSFKEKHPITQQQYSFKH